MMVLRLAPSTYSMTMKYVLSAAPMSKTDTMLAWFMRAPKRASSRNMPMKFSLEARCGKTRLMATRFLKPCTLMASPTKTSAMPPAARRSTTRYRCSAMFGQYLRRSLTGCPCDGCRARKCDVWAPIASLVRTPLGGQASRSSVRAICEIWISSVPP
jgi:hypothetical protein